MVVVVGAPDVVVVVVIGFRVGGTNGPAIILNPPLSSLSVVTQHSFVPE